MKVFNWNTIDYDMALKQQLQLVEAVTRGCDEALIICNHPPVVTLGRQTQEGDIQGWSGKIHHISRGGRATYHGPGQVVAYPILNLQKRGCDLHKYLRNLEEACIVTLKDYGIDAFRKSGATGVWVAQGKIASIGIAVKRWISYHGMAINIKPDSQAFQGINPCGYNTQTMVNLENLLGFRVDLEQFSQLLTKNLLELLQLTTDDLHAAISISLNPA